jgi:hypothetical protein
MLIAVFLGVAVIYLAMKAPDPAAPLTGEPNGTSTANMSVVSGKTGPDTALPYLGVYGNPSPNTGKGMPGVWASNIQLLSATSGFAGQKWNGNGASGGESYFPKVRPNTGVLNPLPDGLGTKRLQTQNRQPLAKTRGSKTGPVGKL